MVTSLFYSQSVIAQKTLQSYNTGNKSVESSLFISLCFGKMQGGCMLVFDKLPLFLLYDKQIQIKSAALT